MTLYICSNCELSQKKWFGQCPACGSWNTASESVEHNKSERISDCITVYDMSASSPSEENCRIKTKYKEINRIMGGGITKGSVILIGGNPGIGKSTLLLQIIGSLESIECAYISGEESEEQIKLRGTRLGINSKNISLIRGHNIKKIYETIKNLNKDIQFIVIDSIQTMKTDDSYSFGSINQIRQCTEEIILNSKKLKITTIIVGHVTKDGNIAGPKLLEHMVDTVIYFEANKYEEIRMLRTVKNRYGSTNEVGIMKMTSAGLEEIENPSSMLIKERQKNAIGSSIFVGMEGNRPILVEIQSLITPTYMISPRRNVVGWDQSRLSMILAILENKCNIKLSDKEVYLNIVGGIKIIDPAADLAVALAIISAAENKIIEDGLCAFGEIGLCGEVRSATNTEHRIKEAENLGFNFLIMPKSKFNPEIQFKKIRHVYELKQFIKTIKQNQDTHLLSS